MIPLATTTITVSRPAAGDLRDSTTYSTVATGVRAHIGGPGGGETVDRGSSSEVVFRLDADPCDLRHSDRVTDATGEVYEVVWAKQRKGLGLDHTVADLRQVNDRVSI